MTKTKYRSRSEQGAALVIAIFSLMLISVVATALILTAGTQSAIKSNYRSAMQAFYAAKAGLEEARGRLWKNNPDIANCVLPTGSPMQVGQVCYIINPAAGETVDPRDSTNPYFDVEYQQEWQASPPSGAQLVHSTFPSSTSGIAGPLYKWVRITPKTEGSVKFDADADGVIDTTSLFLYGQNIIDSKNPVPPGAAQVLTITSLAVTPYGSRRMVQYTVAAAPLTTALPIFPSALTLDGNSVSFTGPSGDDTAKFQINGNDNNTAPNNSLAPSCNGPSRTSSGIPAIGYTNSNDGLNISSKAVPSVNYPSPGGTPSVAFLPPWTPQAPNGLPPILQTPSGLDSLVQSIKGGADLVLSPPPGAALDQTSLPSTMSATNPVVVVVNGNFNLHGYGTGYGLLLVTGTLDYDPDASWNGLILVIGQGIFTSTRIGVGVINGAVFIAKTRDGSGNLLPDPNLGQSSFTQTGGGCGIQYSSAWVKASQALLPYQVLSFREIPQMTP